MQLAGGISWFLFPWMNEGMTCPGVCVCVCVCVCDHNDVVSLYAFTHGTVIETVYSSFPEIFRQFSAKCEKLYTNIVLKIGQKY